MLEASTSRLMTSVGNIDGDEDFGEEQQVKQVVRGIVLWSRICPTGRARPIGSFVEGATPNESQSFWIMMVVHNLRAQSLRKQSCSA